MVRTSLSINVCVLLIVFVETDPPTSDGLIGYPQVPAGLLTFTIVATIIFMSVAMALIVFTIALRKNQYVINIYIVI